MQNKTIAFVLGGARSGKSAHAQRLIEQHCQRPVFIATAQAWDAEMAARIRAHQAERDVRWRTVEAPLDLARALKQAAELGDGVLIDCLTLWLSNLMLNERCDLAHDTEMLIEALQHSALPVWLVSNEVGLGLVPETPLGRRFRDAQGRLNQRIAALADRVEFIAAGLPLRLKG